MEQLFTTESEGTGEMVEQVFTGAGEAKGGGQEKKEQLFAARRDEEKA